MLRELFLGFIRVHILSRRAFYRVLAKWLTANSKCALLISHNNDFDMLKQISFLEINFAK